MKIKSNILDVLKNSTDLSDKAYRLGSLFFPLQLATNDYLYIGYKKQLNQIYIELKTVNSVAGTLILEQWNGSAWVNLPIFDETECLSKSGFVYFDEDSNQGKKSTYNSKEQVWYRLKTSVTTSDLELYGINLVFCNLEDLRSEEPAIEKFYPREIKSHILSQVAARDYILRRINNTQMGHFYVNDILKVYVAVQDFTQFDLMEINEIRDAATYYTLYKIFSNRSDTAEDVYRQKAAEYLAKFESTFSLFSGRKLTLDVKGDGKPSENEGLTTNIKSSRIVR